MIHKAFLKNMIFTYLFFDLNIYLLKSETKLFNFLNLLWQIRGLE